MATVTIQCASFRNGLVVVTADYDSDFDAFIQVTHLITQQSASRTIPAHTTATRNIPVGIGLKIGKTIEDDGSNLPSIASDTISFLARVPA